MAYKARWGEKSATIRIMHRRHPDWTVRQIAEDTEINPNTVRSALRYAGRKAARDTRRAT